MEPKARQQAPNAASTVLFMALAAVILAPVTAAYESCPIGQVYDDSKGRCTQCPVGTVKAPNVDGADWATCEGARLVCGTAEVAKFGSCLKCPATQVAVDDVKCANCPSGYSKQPSGVVSDAACRRSSICVPRTEVCNGKDDDCDGQVDENLGTKSCGKGACYRTVPACLYGKPQSCEPGRPKTEVCNGIDDDCDGSVDEGLGSSSCGRGACYNTVPKCLNGRPQACKPKPPSKEVCDGIDNNCNGQVDEGLPDLYCTPCNKKAPSCKNGRPATCAGVCGNPCCEDCAGYSNPVDKLKCFSHCQNCKDEQQCLQWADSVGDKVAQVACDEAASKCGLLLRAFDVAGSRQVTILQCYYAAYDQCSSRGDYFTHHTSSGTCSYYNSGGGSCSAAQFRSYVDDRIEELCHDVAVGIAVSLP